VDEANTETLLVGTVHEFLVRVEGLQLLPEHWYSATREPTISLIRHDIVEEDHSPFRDEVSVTHEIAFDALIPMVAIDEQNIDLPAVQDPLYPVQCVGMI
jgi:hypothetical protein